MAWQVLRQKKKNNSKITVLSVIGIIVSVLILAVTPFYWRQGVANDVRVVAVSVNDFSITLTENATQNHFYASNDLSAIPPAGAPALLPLRVAVRDNHKILVTTPLVKAAGTHTMTANFHLTCEVSSPNGHRLVLQQLPLRLTLDPATPARATINLRQTVPVAADGGAVDFSSSHGGVDPTVQLTPLLGGAGVEISVAPVVFAATPTAVFCEVVMRFMAVLGVFIAIGALL